MPGFRLEQRPVQKLDIRQELHAPRDVFKTWFQLERQTALPESLLALDTDRAMEDLYARYQEEKPRYTQVRTFRGVIRTPEQFKDFWKYCRAVQDLNPGRRIPICLFYPSCVGSEASRNDERISLIAPAPGVYDKAAVHFVMMRPDLDELGVHYQEDMSAIAEGNGVRSEFYDNGLDDRFFPDLRTSLDSGFPQWMLDLPPSRAVSEKYKSDPAQYSRLRHLGIITREQLGDLFNFLQEKHSVENTEGSTASPYCYPSSADPSLVSVNIPSPIEKCIFVNVSVPLDAIGSIEAFTRECVKRSIDMAVVPGSMPLPVGDYPTGGVYPKPIEEFGKSFGVNVHGLWLLLKDAKEFENPCRGLMRALIFGVIEVSELMAFLGTSDNAYELAISLDDISSFTLRDALSEIIRYVPAPSQRLRKVKEVFDAQSTSIDYKVVIDVPNILEQARKWNPRIPDSKILAQCKGSVLMHGIDEAVRQIDESLIAVEAAPQLFHALRGICTREVLGILRSSLQAR